MQRVDRKIEKRARKRHQISGAVGNLKRTKDMSKMPNYSDKVIPYLPGGAVLPTISQTKLDNVAYSP